MKRRSAVLLAFLALAPGTVLAQLAPPSTGGVVELDRLLQQLAQPRRVLMIAAHPDDEDTGLLARVALGDGARAAYLSLSRGEGGQNLIGNELGAELGLLRSRELQAARSIDGAQQFFSRAFDFGYTRSLDETASKWPLDSLLKDAIRVVRTFRPHVMVSVFSGTPRDGHGQHQAAGVTAQRAFELAGDPSVFPELATEEGLEPWTPLKLYRSTRFDRTATTATLQTGVLDVRTGRSYHQIAMDSRSQHRSQDMGTLQEPGPQQSNLRIMANRTAAPDSGGFFDGIELDQSPLARLADSLRGALSPTRMHELVAPLARAMDNQWGDSRTPPQDDPNAVRAFFDNEDRWLLSKAIAVAAGIVFDVTSSDDAIVPGQDLTLSLHVYNGGLSNVSVSWAVDWRMPVRQDPSSAMPSPDELDLAPGEEVEFDLGYLVGDAEPTQPYFLVNDHRGVFYDWTGTPVDARGLPFQPPLATARAVLTVDGVRIDLKREVSHRIRDQARGEVRTALRVVPRVDVKLEPGAVVWPVDQQPERSFTAVLTYNGNERYAGTVTLAAEGWDPVSPQPFTFSRPGESRRFTFAVHPPAGAVGSTATLVATATGDDGQSFQVGVNTVDYSHIRAAHWVAPAAAEVVLTSLVAPPLARIGYIRGAADRIPEALEQVGVQVELLGPEELEGAELSVFDAIIVGPRAYETDDALQRNNARLLEYSRNGGHLVVQYQQYQFVRGGYAAHPLTIGRPHDRVTDETAPMRILVPEHPVFRGVNRITETDWAGWPQERGLYFAQTWDDAYQPLIESQDPGRDPVRGVLLYSEYGAGTYVYTGISFFRALPAGNPGAFKLFLNLVGAGRAGVPQ